MTLELDLEIEIVLSDESKSIAPLKNIVLYIVSGIKLMECREE